MIFFLGGAFGVALSVTVVELQAPGTGGLFGLSTGPGAVYANGIFALTGLALVALCLTPLIPGKAPEPRESTE
jgi:MFS transporter, DHA2 family, metal-tetracycline-proton antiporter